MGPFSRIPNAENLYYVVDGHVTTGRPQGDRRGARKEATRWERAGFFSLHFAAKRRTETITLATASLRFLTYAFAVAIVFNFRPSVAWREFVLLAASIGFLGFFSHRPAEFIPLAAFLLFAFISLRLMQAGATRLFCSPPDCWHRLVYLVEEIRLHTNSRCFSARPT